jgi:hypothetical protein
MYQKNYFSAISGKSNPHLLEKIRLARQLPLLTRTLLSIPRVVSVDGMRELSSIVALSPQCAVAGCTISLCELPPVLRGLPAATRSPTGNPD